MAAGDPYPSGSGADWPVTEAEARRVCEILGLAVICATCRCTIATYHLCPMSHGPCEGFRTIEVARLGARAATRWPLEG